MTASPIAKLDPRFSEPGAVATPWPDVEQVISDAELFWISTVRGDGRPHVVPLPAVWHDGRAHFCTGPTEQKAANLAANPRCALTTGVNRWKQGLDVVIEGRARRVQDTERLRLLADLWEAKYDGDWHYEVAEGAFHHDAGEAHVFEVVPEKVLAFSKEAFGQTSYRF